MAVLDDKSIHRRYSSVVCSNCFNLVDIVNRSCLAFQSPEIIPDDIWKGKNTHKKSVEGDDGILFTKVTEDNIVQRNKNMKIATL